MNTLDAIKKRRTIRRFSSILPRKRELLRIIDCARLAPSAANLQPLKFMIVTSKKDRLNLYPYIKYAGYIPDWNPAFDETPPAFIFILNDTKIKPSSKSEIDCGAAIANMCLAATELGLDTCWIGSVEREKANELLNIPIHLDIMYVLGVGYGLQTGKIIDMENNNHKYYLDKSGNLVVPKRKLKDIIL